MVGQRKCAVRIVRCCRGFDPQSWSRRMVLGPHCARLMYSRDVESDFDFSRPTQLRPRGAACRARHRILALWGQRARRHATRRHPDGRRRKTRLRSDSGIWRLPHYQARTFEPPRHLHGSLTGTTYQQEGV